MLFGTKVNPKIRISEEDDVTDTHPQRSEDELLPAETDKGKARRDVSSGRFHQVQIRHIM